MGEQKREELVPVVVDGAVEYLPGETIVTWPKTGRGRSKQPLGSFGRAVDTNEKPDDCLLLPDGREGTIEGWKNEALRLRACATSLPAGCAVWTYTFTIDRGATNDPEYVTVEARPGVDDAGKPVTRWGIFRNGFAWTRDRNGFCHEPLPSSRTPEFLATVRWDTAEEALLEAAEHAVPFVQKRWERRVSGSAAANRTEGAR